MLPMFGTKNKYTPKTNDTKKKNMRNCVTTKPDIDPWIAILPFFRFFILGMIGSTVFKTPVFYLFYVLQTYSHQKTKQNKTKQNKT